MLSAMIVPPEMRAIEQRFPTPAQAVSFGASMAMPLPDTLGKGATAGQPWSARMKKPDQLEESVGHA